MVPSYGGKAVAHLEGIGFDVERSDEWAVWEQGLDEGRGVDQDWMAARNRAYVELARDAASRKPTTLMRPDISIADEVVAVGSDLLLVTAPEADAQRRHEDWIKDKGYEPDDPMSSMRWQAYLDGRDKNQLISRKYQLKVYDTVNEALGGPELLPEPTVEEESGEESVTDEKPAKSPTPLWVLDVEGVVWVKISPKLATSPFGLELYSNEPPQEYWDRNYEGTPPSMRVELPFYFKDGGDRWHAFWDDDVGGYMYEAIGKEPASGRRPDLEDVTDRLFAESDADSMQD